MLFVVLGVDRRGEAHARAIHEDVDGAERGDDLGDDALDRRAIGHVERPVRIAGEVRRVAVGRGDLRPFRVEHLGDGSSHPARRARHEHDLACHTPAEGHDRASYRRVGSGWEAS